MTHKTFYFLILKNTETRLLCANTHQKIKLLYAADRHKGQVVCNSRKLIIGKIATTSWSHQTIHVLLLHVNFSAALTW